jgi:hypothetical protein
MVYKKAKTYDEARRIQEFLAEKNIGAEVKRNRDFMSDKYPYKVVGNDEEGLGVVERNERIVNVVTGEVKRQATWNKPRHKWNNRPKRVRT